MVLVSILWSVDGIPSSPEDVCGIEFEDLPEPNVGYIIRSRSYLKVGWLAH